MVELVLAVVGGWFVASLMLAVAILTVRALRHRHRVRSGIREVVTPEIRIRAVRPSRLTSAREAVRDRVTGHEPGHEIEGQEVRP